MKKNIHFNIIIIKHEVFTQFLHFSILLTTKYTDHMCDYITVDKMIHNQLYILVYNLVFIIYEK